MAEQKKRAGRPPKNKKAEESPEVIEEIVIDTPIIEGEQIMTALETESISEPITEEQPTKKWHRIDYTEHAEKCKTITNALRS